MKVKHLIAMLLFIGLLAGGSFLYKDKILFFWKTISRVVSYEPSVKEIKDIMELSVTEYVVTSGVHEGRRELGKAVSKFTVSFEGSVKGTLDLSKAKIDINKEKKNIKIEFGKDAVKISNPQLAPNSLKSAKIYNVWSIIGSGVREQEIEKAVNSALSAMLKVAKDKGIEDETKKRGKVVLERFYSPMGYSVEIEYR